MTTFFTVSLKLLEGFGTTFLIFAITLLLAIPLGLPIALMFATLLGLSRLAADSEIKAALASGLKPKLAEPSCVEEVTPSKH